MGSSFILASASPRRRDLLAALGFDFQCEISRVEEEREKGEPPPAFAERLAKDKAAAVFARRTSDLPVLAADTVVFLGDRVLDKPANEAEAASTLAALSGRTHEVVTGVAIRDNRQERSCAVVTSVRFRALSAPEIDWYVATGEPMDKAGAYAIQGLGSFLIDTIDGSPSNVVGLPLSESIEMLEAAGVIPPWRLRAERLGSAPWRDER
ncbi:MAG: Maf family protein [Myxococcota bacterium]